MSFKIAWISPNLFVFACFSMPGKHDLHNYSYNYFPDRMSLVIICFIYCMCKWSLCPLQCLTGLPLSDRQHRGQLFKPTLPLPLTLFFFFFSSLTYMCTFMSQGNMESDVMTSFASKMGITSAKIIRWVIRERSRFNTRGSLRAAWVNVRAPSVSVKRRKTDVN